MSDIEVTERDYEAVCAECNGDPAWKAECRIRVWDNPEGDCRKRSRYARLVAQARAEGYAAGVEAAARAVTWDEDARVQIRALLAPASAPPEAPAPVTGEWESGYFRQFATGLVVLEPKANRLPGTARPAIGGDGMPSYNPHAACDPHRPCSTTCTAGARVEPLTVPVEQPCPRCNDNEYIPGTPESGCRKDNDCDGKCWLCSACQPCPDCGTGETSGAGTDQGKA